MIDIDAPTPTTDNWDIKYNAILNTEGFCSNLDWLRWFNKKHLDSYLEDTKPLVITEPNRLELRMDDITKSYFLQNHTLRNWLKDLNIRPEIFRVETDFEYEEGLKPIFNICHRNVEIAVELYGGTKIECYQIRRFRRTCYTTSSHSIWKDISGNLRDITPEHPLDPTCKGRLVGFPENKLLIHLCPRLISPCFVKNPFYYQQLLNTGIYEKLEVE